MKQGSQDQYNTDGCIHLKGMQVNVIQLHLLSTNHYMILVFINLLIGLLGICGS